LQSESEGCATSDMLMIYDLDAGTKAELQDLVTWLEVASVKFGLTVRDDRT